MHEYALLPFFLCVRCTSWVLTSYATELSSLCACVYVNVRMFVCLCVQAHMHCESVCVCVQPHMHMCEFIHA